MDLDAGETSVRAETEPRPPVARYWRNPAVAGLLLLCAYLALSFVVEPFGGLTSDTGPKVATLRTMEVSGTWSPEVGYWAAADDPDGALHPLYSTRQVGDHWVSIATIPMVVAAHPLWDIGGHRFALLLPMLGAIACAFAAGSLARRLGSDSPQLVFWVVGLASPVVVYALDFWEHTPGLALMLWGFVALLDVDGGARAWVAIFSGAAFGVAATMRTEALVYGAVSTVGLLLVPAVRRGDLRKAVTRGGLVLFGLVVGLATNEVLERALLGGASRSQRTSSVAGDAASDVADRLSGAMITTFSTGSNGDGIAIAIGVATAVFVGLAAFGLQRGWSKRVPLELLAFAGVLVLIRVFLGVGHVAGFAVAFPAAAAGAAVAWREPKARKVAGVAVAALPVVWLTQFTVNPGSQWGGRYLLASSIVLGVVGLVTVASLDARFARALVGLCIAMSVLGVATLSDKSRDNADMARVIAGTSADVVIARTPHLFRLAALEYTPERQWLTAWQDDDVTAAVQVAQAHDADTIMIVSLQEKDSQPRIPGWRVTDHAQVGRRGFFVTTYERD